MNMSICDALRRTGVYLKRLKLLNTIELISMLALTSSGDLATLAML